MTDHQLGIDTDDGSLYNAVEMTRRSLDEVDRRIIAALQEDGRMPFAAIARRLEVSAGMVRERYLRLVEQGILQVVAVTNPLHRGYRMMTLVGIKADGGRLHEIAKEIACLDEVVYLVLCTGTFDMLAEVICRDNAELLRFLTGRLHTIEGIRDTQTFVYLDIAKEIYI